MTGSIDDAINKAILSTTNVLANDDGLNLIVYDILLKVISDATKKGSNEIHPPNLARSSHKL